MLLFARVGVFGVAWLRMTSAAVIGAIVLRQIPTVQDAAGITLVVLGVAIHQQERK